MRKLFVFILLSVLLLPGRAQRNNIWYFGEQAGLDFNANNTNNPVPVALTNSAMITQEGCSSICDNNGALLFYSNGVDVFNRNHQVMLNGSGLKGHISAVQSCIIVPHPGDNNLYYIFTTDAFENSWANGYCYSIVDMRGDNGNGEVVSKNNLLWPSCSERLTAARHANGNDVWIITNDNNSNTFRAWLLNCNGLQTTPVVSNAGVVLNQHRFTNVGMMKVSPDGKQLCQTHYPQLDLAENGSNFFQLFDFDNNTGIISNAKQISEPNFAYFACEFSPNSSLLYVIHFFQDTIDQFQSKLPGIPAILASKYSFKTINQYNGIQLAPDGKIYLGRQSSGMAAINNPDIPGTGCNFISNQLNLNGKRAGLGLPGFINDVSSDPFNNFNYQVLDSCSGTVQFNGVTQLQGNVLWQWDFGDGASSSLQNPVHQFTPAQQVYVVKLSVSNNILCTRNFEKIKQVKPSGIVNEIDFQFSISCDTVHLVNTTTDLANSIGQFTWDFGDGASSNEISPTHIYAAGSYTIQLTLTTPTPCLNKTISHPINISTFTIQAPPDQSVLVGRSVQLVATGPPGTTYRWSPFTALSSATIQDPVASPVDDIVYTVTGTYHGCDHEDSVLIHVVQLDDFYVPSAFTPNGDGKNDDIKPFYGTKFILQEFAIFNRMGQKVFSTNRRGKGWDGTVAGRSQNADGYVWIIKAKDNNGKAVVRKGIFTLIR
ncbi:MAG: PKD domain-containing protein [Bacteroidota bacterium]|nr:PKD domain-containing protein [Bacteroidota bacterium]